MDEKSIRVLLHNLQVSVQKHSYTGLKSKTRWLNISCPFAQWTHSKQTDNNPSFGIIINDVGGSHYKCLTCNLKGRLSGLPTRLGGYRKKDYSKLRLWAEATELSATTSRPVPSWEDADPVAIDYSSKHVDPDQTVPDCPDDAGYSRALGVPYLRDRGIGYPTTLKLDLRFDDMQQRVLFPVYDRYSAFAGFTGRSIRKGNNDTKGRDPKVKDYFGLPKRELFLGLRNPKPMRDDKYNRKIISEGLFDFAMGVKHGYPFTRAILGTSMTPEKLDILIDEGDPVYFFVDNDLAGWQALFGVPDDEGGWNTDNAWAFQLYKEIPVWIVPYGNHLDGLDPGSIRNKATYDKMVARAWPFTGKAPLNDLDEPTLRHIRSI